MGPCPYGPLPMGPRPVLGKVRFTQIFSMKSKPASISSRSILSIALWLYLTKGHIGHLISPANAEGQSLWEDLVYRKTVQIVADDGLRRDQVIVGIDASEDDSGDVKGAGEAEVATEKTEKRSN